MSYQRYKGKSKYHFRYYRKTKYHPFLVVLVTNENGNGSDVKISGFNMTSSTLRFLERPSRFIKLDKNPNPEWDAESYVSIDFIENQPAKWFTRPIRRWKLSKEDENKIDELLKKKKNDSSEPSFHKRSLILIEYGY